MPLDHTSLDGDMIVLFQGGGGCHPDLLPRGPPGHDCRLLFPYHRGDAGILWDREKKPAASGLGMAFLSSLYYGQKDQLWLFDIGAQDSVLPGLCSDLGSLFNSL